VRWLNNWSGRPIVRYARKEEIEARLFFIDDLFAQFRDGRVLNEQAHPRVNIGREKRVAIDDGRHRLCLAKIAGLSRYRVTVSVLHRDQIDAIADFGTVVG
jgi:hypothetical protein